MLAPYYKVLISIIVVFCNCIFWTALYATDILDLILDNLTRGLFAGQLREFLICCGSVSTINLFPIMMYC